MICRLTSGKEENETHLRVQMIHSSYKRRKRCSPNSEVRDTGCSIFLLSGNEYETSCMFFLLSRSPKKLLHVEQVCILPLCLGHKIVT